MKKLRKNQAALNLPTLTLEGGLFLPDQLEKAALGSAQWQTEADYGTPKGLKLKDDYSRAFQIACAQWKHFAAQLERADVDAAALTHSFVHELLRDGFGYSHLQACTGLTLGERHYPLSLLAGSVPVVVAPHTLAVHEADPRFAIAGSGTRKKSAFMLMQELLNASPEHLWGMVCNGKTLRLLRDAATLTRPSFVEIDLADLLGGQRYAEFTNVWRLLHASRAPQAANGEWGIANGEWGMANGKQADHSPFATRHLPLSCIWEKWRTAGQEEGTRVRDGLRQGVTEALLILGAGFIQHPTNDALRGRLHSGELSKEAYFQQLLRLIYRLIFVFSVEERGLLHSQGDNDNAQAARRAYAEGYALARLRGLCLKRRARNRFDDHWQAIKIVFKGLSAGEPRLDLPALGGLFAHSQCPVLDAASLDNAHLLAAMHNLRWASHALGKGGSTLAPVDYRNMGPEELGSVYESLLELVPEINLPARIFGFVGLGGSANGEQRMVNGEEQDHSPFATGHSPLTTSHSPAKGNARKLSGSYYTPDALVQELIQSALDPVIEQRLSEAGRMANGEWSMLSPQYREVFIQYAHTKLSRPGGVAARAQASHGNLSIYRNVPGEGTLWTDRPNEAGSGINSEQYRGGLGTALSGGISPISENSQREQGRIGDTTDFVDRSRVQHGIGFSPAPGTNHDTRQTAAVTGTQFEEVNGDSRVANAKKDSHSPYPSLWQSTSTTIRHSLFTTHALLSIRVIDPACGSGHFLLAAARRLAEKLAQLRATDGEQTEPDFRHALREVVSRCIFGVDRNPMAIELARTALWLEGFEPGRPLGFLDHHLQVGDALLGLTDLKALERGIAKDAFKPLSGDDKEVCKQLAKINAAALKDLEKKRNASAFGQLDVASQHISGLSELQALEALPEDTRQQIAAKEAAYRALLEQAKTSRLAHAADLLVGAFLLPKTTPPSPPGRGARGEGGIPTSATLYLTLLGDTLPADQQNALAAAQAVCAEARVLHWPLAFPQVFASGGFDCVLGNPPWERIKLQEEEFFASRHRAVAEAKNKAERSQRIQWLADGVLAVNLASGEPPIATAGNADSSPLTIHPTLAEAEQRLYAEFIRARRTAEAASVFAHVKGADGGRYPLTGVGDVNTYALFAETISQITAFSPLPRGEGLGVRGEGGRAGFIVPTGIATDDSTKAFFGHITQNGQLVSLYDIENREAVFPSVHRSYKFCLLTLGRAAQAEFVCFATRVEQLADPRRRFSLTPDEFRLINPNTLTCPVFRSERDAELTKKLYRTAPVLIAENKPDGNPWGISFMAMMHMSGDSHLFVDASQVNGGVANGGVANSEWRMANGGLAGACDPSPLTTRHSPYLPLYEAKMIHQFDHRWASYGVNGERRTADGALAGTFDPSPESRDVTNDEKADPNYSVTPRYWVSQAEVEERLNAKGWTRGWLMGWRDICRATDYRTLIANVIPKAAVGDKFLLMLPTCTPKMSAALLGCLNSLVCDFVARQKVGGTAFKYFTMRQIPVLPPSHYTAADLNFITPRVLELTYTAHDLQAWAQDLISAWRMENGAWKDGTPPAIRHSPLAIHPFNPDRRAQVRAELDAYYAKLYGLTRDELRYILDPADIMGEDYPSETFRVLKTKEQKQFGEYRTQRLVLAAWDKLERGELH